MSKQKVNTPILFKTFDNINEKIYFSAPVKEKTYLLNKVIEIDTNFEKLLIERTPSGTSNQKIKKFELLGKLLRTQLSLKFGNKKANPKRIGV